MLPLVTFRLLVSWDPYTYAFHSATICTELVSMSVKDKNVCMIDTTLILQAHEASR